MSKLTDDAAFLLADLEKYGIQFSWDWQADLRFAQYLQDTEAIAFFEWATDDTKRQVLPYLVAMVREHGEKTRQRRLRALRLLVEEKKVEAKWAGMGPMAVHDFGLNRARAYKLKGDAAHK